MSDFIEKFSVDTKNILSQRERALIKAAFEYRFKKPMTYCDICTTALTPSEKNSVNLFSVWKTCTQHRHLANVPNPDTYLEKYGHFNHHPQMNTEAAENLKQVFSALPFFQRLKILFA